MKLFQLIQKNFSVLGITSNQTKYSRIKLVMTLIIYGLITTSSILFLVFEADTFDEFTNNIYITSGCVMMCIIFVIMAFKQGKLFELIDSFDKFIDKSK